MKKLNKKTLKSLSKDKMKLPLDMTPHIAGGDHTDQYSDNCGPSVPRNPTWYSECGCPTSPC
ncbi:hypothetical protein L1077_22345 [Pseudoalteromonas luteoviolacea]|uniref:hypothetical protein n=1 Tax=Pseudoalteromonas luteoviolacea TaxID=43657 RepID=UPI001F36CB5B|nr:hypothetical protein [Pseudoalteromonas luteoviolacea]MCF6442170.1 hypothetical protein [Pseudoalteromonas luteoviolacea]